MKRISLVLATMSLGVAPVLAADVIYDEPPAPMAVVAPAGWTGFYLGVQGGGAFSTEEPDYIAVSTSFGGPVLAGTPLVDQFSSNYRSESSASFLGGVSAGYDYQIGNAVIGAVADINWIDYSETTGVVSTTARAFYDQQRSIDYLATARLRAGYLVTPTALAYVTGGLAYAEIDYGFSTNSTGFTSASVNEDEDDFGYSVGAGMEVKVTDNVSFGAEYLYTNLGAGDSFTNLSGGVFSGGVAGGTTRFSTDDDFDFHTVTAKMSYRFN